MYSVPVPTQTAADGEGGGNNALVAGVGCRAGRAHLRGTSLFVTL